MKKPKAHDPDAAAWRALCRTRPDLTHGIKTDAGRRETLAIAKREMEDDARREREERERDERRAARDPRFREELAARRFLQAQHPRAARYRPSTG